MYRCPHISLKPVLSSHSETAVLMFISKTHLLLLVHFFSTFILLSLWISPQPPPLSLLPPHFLFTLLHQKHRIGIWLTDCLSPWLNGCLTDSLSSKAACITTLTWPQLQTKQTNYSKHHTSEVQVRFDPTCVNLLFQREANTFNLKV